RPRGPRAAYRVDTGYPTHVGLQRGGNADAAVRALIVLHDRDQRSADGHAGAVQGVHQLGLALRVADPRLHAASLKRLAIRARGNLPVFSLSRQPPLEIIGLRRSEVRV